MSAFNWSLLATTVTPDAGSPAVAPEMTSPNQQLRWPKAFLIWGVQLALLGVLFFPAAQVQLAGDNVILRVAAVDPFDPFMGYYQNLELQIERDAMDYIEVSQLAPGLISDFELEGQILEEGDEIWLVVEREASRWVLEEAFTEMPQMRSGTSVKTGTWDGSELEMRTELNAKPTPGELERLMSRLLDVDNLERGDRVYVMERELPPFWSLLAPTLEDVQPTENQVLILAVWEGRRLHVPNTGEFYVSEDRIGELNRMLRFPQGPVGVHVKVGRWGTVVMQGIEVNGKMFELGEPEETD